MLKIAYGNTTDEEINKLINEGNYPYLNMSSYKEYNMVQIESDELNSIQRISVDEEGNILAYFEAQVDNEQEKIDGTLFIKFRDSYDNFDEEVADNDFQQFVDFIMNHKKYSRVEVRAFSENHANKTYEKWLEKYNGERFLLKDYSKLPDGKLYDVWLYWFRRIIISKSFF